MTSSDVWGPETAQRYDDEDAGMFAPEVLGPTDWDRSPFTGESTKHVSVWRKPA